MDAPKPALMPLRFLAFVALNVLIVALYVDLLVGALPPLADEGRALVVVPVVVLATLGFVAMYPLLRAASTHALRLGILTLFIAVGVVVEALFFVVSTGGSAPEVLSLVGVALFAAVVQLVYGAPLFAGLAVFNKLASPVLIARPARRWI